MHLKQLSVAIVTKNRSKMLTRCLLSLLGGGSYFEIIVIDNNSTDDTKLVVANLQKKTHCSIKYIFSRALGYPRIRNLALKTCQTKWLAFIDDDCIVDVNWSNAIDLLISQKKNSELVAVLGSVKNFDDDNVFALTADFLEQLWKGNRLDKHKILDYEILDNKNLLLNKQYLLKQQIKYDEQLVTDNHLGSSEDCDLGMQLWLKKARVLYQPNMIVFHEYNPHFLLYYQRLFRLIGERQFYEQKWCLFRQQIVLEKKLGLRFLYRYLISKRLSFFKSVIFLVNLLVSYLLIKLFRLKNNIYEIIISHYH